MIVSHSLFFIFSLSVHSSLGYKDAVKCVYERKLLEARTEAQQDPQYFLHGDVSKLFKKKKDQKIVYLPCGSVGVLPRGTFHLNSSV